LYPNLRERAANIAHPNVNIPPEMHTLYKGL